MHIETCKPFVIIQDELLWGAAWLYKASKQPLYLNFILNNKQQLAERSPPFSWDDKHAGVHVLLSQVFQIDPCMDNSFVTPTTLSNHISSFICRQK